MGGVRYTPANIVGNEFATKAYQIAHQTYYEGNEPYTMDIPSDRHRLVVPTVLLIGHQTASAAEDFLILPEKQKHMTKIGQHSNESTGNPVMYELDGNILMGICSKKDTYPDSRPFVGCRIKPDIEVIPTVKDFIRPYGRALEEALTYLKNKK